MADQEMHDAGSGARGGEGGVALGAGACRQRGAGDKVGQWQQTGWNAKGGETVDREHGLGGGVAAQAVVYDQRQQAAAARACPGGGENGQGKTVGAARDGRGQARRGLERAERRHEVGKFVRADGCEHGRRLLVAAEQCHRCAVVQTRAMPFEPARCACCRSTNH